MKQGILSLLLKTVFGRCYLETIVSNRLFTLAGDMGTVAAIHSWAGEKELMRQGITTLPHQFSRVTFLKHQIYLSR